MRKRLKTKSPHGEGLYKQLNCEKEFLGVVLRFWMIWGELGAGSIKCQQRWCRRRIGPKLSGFGNQFGIMML